MLKARTLVVAFALFAALSPLAGQAQAGAQSEPTASPASFTERVEVNVINVDVVVTDRSGKPIPGLTEEDFEVYDQGARVAITNFAALQEPRHDAGAIGTALGAAGQTAGEPLQLVVLLDNVNTRPQNRAHMLGQLKEVLAGLGPRDRVMLVSYDKSITVHQTWTGDPTEIAAGVARLEATPNYGLEMDNELDVVYSFMEYALEGEAQCVYIIDEAVSRYTGVVTHRVLTTIGAIQDFLGSLAGLPGRKSLLYISDGLELRPGSHIVKRMAGRCGDDSSSIRAEGYDIALGLKKLSSAANSARVTLYPLDAAGGRQAPGAVRRDGAGHLDQRANLQDSLAFLAADTGGRALLNAIDLPTAMKPVWSDLGSYYSLGYEAPAAGTGDLRKVEVKVKRKGVDVRYRHGYLDRTAEERLNDQLLAALWAGQSPNALGVRMEPAGEAVEMEGGRRVPLRIGVPLANLTLEPKGTAREGQFTVFVTSRDPRGGRSAISSSVVPVSIPADQIEAAHEQLFGYEIGLLMPDGRQRVAIGVRDDLSQVVSIITHEIEVGPRPPQQP